MTTAPDPRHPQERLEDYQEVLAEVLDELSKYTPLSLEAKYEFAQRLELAVGWKVADQMKETVEFLNGDDAAPLPVQRMSAEERRATLRRRKVLVHILLIVAISTLLTSLYALGLGHDALGWFGLAGSSGLAYMALRAEGGK